MKPLKKSDRRRFNEICKLIRQTLHIDHWRTSYIVDAKADGTAAATYYHYDEGDYITIYLRPFFWQEDDAEWQIRALIHEHCHAVLCPMVQAYNAIPSHPSDSQGAKSIFGLANERVTCHLEAIIYDLIRDKLK